MDVTKAITLGELPKTVKWYLTMFLVVMTCGYLMAIVNVNTAMGLVRETYTPGQPVQFEFGGSPYKNIVEHYRGSVEDPMAYPGIDLVTLVSTSHTHFIAMGLMVFCLGIPFLFTVTLPEWLKKFVLVDSFVAVIIAVTAFWFIKYISPVGAYLMMLSGMLLGFCVMFETAVPLYEMWLVKCECETPAKAPVAAVEEPEGEGQEILPKEAPAEKAD